VQDELSRIGLCALLIRSEDSGLGAGHFDGGGVIGKALMDDVEGTIFLFDPFGRRIVIGGSRPHALHLGSELDGQVHRADGFDLKECKDAGAVRSIVGRKEDLADGEIGMGKCDGGVIGADLDESCLVVDIDRNGIILHVSSDAKIAENLPGKDPRFERTILVAKYGSAGTDDGKGMGGNGLADDLERDGVFERKSG